MEFAINTTKELKKKIKKMKGLCAEYHRRMLVTYNRCQVAADKRLDAIPEHELFIEHL